jgi:hypothetical protein
MGAGISIVNGWVSFSFSLNSYTSSHASSGAETKAFLDTTAAGLLLVLPKLGSTVLPYPHLVEGLLLVVETGW